MIVEAYSPVTGDAVKTAIQALTIYIAVVGWFAAARDCICGIRDQGLANQAGLGLGWYT